MKALAALANLLLVAIVFSLGTISVPQSTVPMPGNDKVGHALAFFAVGVAQYWLFFEHTRPRRDRAVARFRCIAATLGATGIGALLEVVQLWLPARQAELGDLAADFAGASVGAGLMFVILR